jgi:hypothetical protein
MGGGAKHRDERAPMDDASIVLAAAGDITRGNLQATKNSEP